jgi:hypothetical protein
LGGGVGGGVWGGGGGGGAPPPPPPPPPPHTHTHTHTHPLTRTRTHAHTLSHSHSLTVLRQAQAQEVFWNKCAAERRAPELLSKIAGQAADYFGSAHTTLAARPDTDKAWLALLAAKRLFFLAEAQLQAGKAGVGADHGVILSRLRAARAMAVQLAKGSLGAAERVAVRACACVRFSWGLSSLSWFIPLPFIFRHLHAADAARAGQRRDGDSRA